MKKWLILLLALGLLGLTACGNSSTSPENSAKSEPKVVEPLSSAIDLDSLMDMDSVIAVSFDPETDIHIGDSSTIDLTVYVPDYYDAEEISQMAPGDTIISLGQPIPVDSIEQKDYALCINGGLDEDGLDLRLNTDMESYFNVLPESEGLVYYTTGWDVTLYYREVGSTSLPIGENFVFIDNSDLQNPGQEYTLEELAAIKDDSVGFYEQNTFVSVDNGVVTKIVREYTP